MGANIQPKIPVVTQVSYSAGNPSEQGRDRNGLAHECFTREITFWVDWVRIQDRVQCRLPCLTIIRQSQSPSCDELFEITATDGRNMRRPIFVEAGRHVGITRLYHIGRLAKEHVQEANSAFPPSTSR